MPGNLMDIMNPPDAQIAAQQPTAPLQSIAQPSSLYAMPKYNRVLGAIFGDSYNQGRERRQAENANAIKMHADVQEIIGRGADAILDAPDDQKPAVYQGVRQELLSHPEFGPDLAQHLPPVYDPAIVLPEVQKIKAAAGMYNDTSKLSALNTHFIDASGNVIGVSKDGTTRVLGKADPRTQLRDVSGVDPSIIDLRNGQQTALGPAPQTNGAPTVPAVQTQVSAPNPSVAAPQAGSTGFQYAGGTPVTQSVAESLVAQAEQTQGQKFAPFVRNQIVQTVMAGGKIGMGGGFQGNTGSQYVAPQAARGAAHTAPAPTAAATPLPAGSARPVNGKEAPAGYSFKPDGSLAVIPGGPADKSATMAGVGDETKTGDAYLASIEDPGLRAYIQSIVHGLNKPENFRTPKGADITPMQIAIAASRADPTFSVTDFNTRNDAMKSFKDGKDAANVQALNQVAAHLQQLEQVAPKLSGMAIPYVGGMVNHAVNAAKDVNTGDLTTWNQVADAVAHETRAVFNNNKGAGTQSELEANLKQLSGDGSTAQKMAALTAIKRLIGSRIAIIEGKYKNALGRGAGDPGILPETRAILSGGTAQSAAPQGGTVWMRDPATGKLVQVK